MALTKIGSIGINTGIQFAGVTTIATLNGSDSVLSVGGTVNFVSDVSIGGTVSIAGTLTYEDVTNIDAVGLITARNGVIVGSGITLSKDGDAFFTGVTTSTTFSGNFSGGTISGTTGTFTGDVDIADKIVHTGDTNTAIRFPTTDAVSVETAGAEQLRINSDGAILKGPTSGRAQFFHSVVNPRVQIEGAGDFDRQMSILSSSSTSSHGGTLILSHQKSGGIGGNTALAAADNLGLFSFQGHDGTNFIEGARIQSTAETGVAANNMRSSLNFLTNSGTTSAAERLRITARGDIAFNRVGMSTAVGDSTDTNLQTDDPSRFVFNNDHSSGYTDASLKLYLYNLNDTRHGFTSGPEYDLQYHTSGSSPANTNLSASKHTFFKENKKIFQLGYKSSTGENVIGHVGLTTGTSKLAWGNPAGDDYRLNTSGGAALVFGVDGDNEFFAVEGHLTGQRHVEYMRISKEGYMTKPYQPSFLVAAGRAGDGFTDTPYQFRTAVRNVDSAFKMTSGTGQYSYYIVPITGLYLFTTHAAYQQTGVSFNTRIHRYNSAGAVQEVLELHRNVGFSGSHAGGAGSCMMYCTTGDYVYVAPDFTPYHLNTTLNFFAGCLLG